MTEHRDTIVICVRDGTAHVINDCTGPAKWESVTTAGRWVCDWEDHPFITPANFVVVVDVGTGEAEVFV